MNCRENHYICFNPITPTSRRDQHFKVTKHKVFKSILGMQLSRAITLQISRVNPRERGRVGGKEGERE